MFKKLYEEINKISVKANDTYERMIILNQTFRDRYEVISTNIHSINAHMPDIESMQKTIESQQRIIEQLTNTLKDKYEHGLFIISNNGRIPVVIRNGKELTNELTLYCSVEWSYGELPRITIEQNGVTYCDMEV